MGEPTEATRLKIDAQFPFNCVFRRPWHSNSERLWKRACSGDKCQNGECRHIQPAYEDGLGGYRSHYLQEEVLPPDEEVIVVEVFPLR